MSSFETLPPPARQAAASTQPAPLPAPEGAGLGVPLRRSLSSPHPSISSPPPHPPLLLQNRTPQTRPALALCLPSHCFAGWRAPRGRRRGQNHRENRKGGEDGCVGAAWGQLGVCLWELLLGRETSVRWSVRIKHETLL